MIRLKPKKTTMRLKVDTAIGKKVYHASARRYLVRVMNSRIGVLVFNN